MLRFTEAAFRDRIDSLVPWAVRVLLGARGDSLVEVP
jgi:hypothetical protein